MIGLFTNSERRRYYGLRIGDVVQYHLRHQFADDPNRIVIWTGNVIDWGFMDNNRVLVQWHHVRKPAYEVAEWLRIVVRVEDLQESVRVRLERGKVKRAHKKGRPRKIHVI